MEPFGGGLVSTNTQVVFLRNIAINLNRERTAGFLRKCDKYCSS